MGVSGLRANRRNPHPAPTTSLALLILPPLLIVVVSGFWFVDSVEHIHNGPARATIFALLGAAFLLPIHVVRACRARRGTALCFVFPALYVTAVAAFLGLWAVGGGGSL